MGLRPAEEHVQHDGSHWAGRVGAYEEGVQYLNSWGQVEVLPVGVCD